MEREDEETGMIEKEEGGKKVWKDVVIGVLLLCTLSLGISTALLAAKAANKASSIGEFFCQISGTIPSTPAPAPSPPVISTELSKVVDETMSACSNQGYKYTGETNCTCMDCYTGARCQTFVGADKCSIDANGGSPYMFAEYWVRYPETEFQMKLSERLGYLPAGIRSRLEEGIRKLHKLAGNAVTDNMNIVFGDGSTPLLTLVSTILQSSTNSLPLKVWAQKPFYSGYSSLSYANLVKFVGDEENRTTAAADEKVVEYVTSPNNPDGEIRTGVLSHPLTVFDKAYSWPMYTFIDQPFNTSAHPLSLWTLSKVTGHASSRVGWALVGDKKLADAMQAMACPIGCPVESQLVAIRAIEHVLSTQGELMKWGRAKFTERWGRIGEVFRNVSCYKVRNPRAEGYDRYDQKVYKQTPPYLWMECLNLPDQKSCGDMLRSYGMKCRDGEYFGMPKSFARLSLYVASPVFNVLIQKLTNMFANTC
ncbi:hypothetical protein GUITHDRAFT_114973 [Guillardia theta CCMP2712]|uniref:Alliinase C-terminal domain-containing protein n=2 Tax=Guillardia theta TaxID=55529 RepID=L1IS14_GUITC|nr:hypothetical protein GUITHDRAFT_114973 [Guillardia theta CCMP2712]EKX38867.1 hypothetical protein GUITHDRAFT_114973 [Guillardia theta CCMP2712]|eukprot:XP_005825847.1 hypothetical protein GUITHDRAFT_114973 [Guillardia theta CCMP2712]